MPGLKQAGLVGVALAVTGGLAYIIWTYVSSEEKKTKVKTWRPVGRRAFIRKTPKKDPEERVEETVEKAQVVTVEAQKTPAVAVSETKPAEKGKQVLVLGLDGAGKTSLLHCFATGSLEQDVAPTKGFNAVSINREDLQIEFLEIGGTENLRPYWTRYMPKAMVLVFVVDSSKADQFTLAKEHLHDLIASDPHLPLVVLANKQDIPGACSITELHGALALADVGEERKLFLIGTHVRKGDQEVNTGVQDARDLIIQMVYDGR